MSSQVKGLGPARSPKWQWPLTRDRVMQLASRLRDSSLSWSEQFEQSLRGLRHVVHFIPRFVSLVCLSSSQNQSLPQKGISMQAE